MGLTHQRVHTLPRPPQHGMGEQNHLELMILKRQFPSHPQRQNRLGVKGGRRHCARSLAILHRHPHAPVRRPEYPRSLGIGKTNIQARTDACVACVKLGRGGRRESVCPRAQRSSLPAFPDPSSSPDRPRRRPDRGTRPLHTNLHPHGRRTASAWPCGAPD